MKIILICFLLTLSIQLFAQELPQVIPPSPKAQEFHKFGDFPVGHTTGVANVSIPLYTIKQSGVEVPIVLKYYYTGFKPGVKDYSNAGLGWTVQVGGRISRTVKGKPDDQYMKKLTGRSLDSNFDQVLQDDVLFLQQRSAKHGSIDTEFDIFKYGFNGRFGDFVIINQGETWQDGFEAIDIPKTNLKINVDRSSHNGHIEGLNITDERGTNFRFGYIYREKESFSVQESDTYSSWMLENIYPKNHNESIDFEYVNLTTNLAHHDYATSAYKAKVKDLHALLISGSYPTNYTGQTGIKYVNQREFPYATYPTNLQTIKSISYKTGSIEFILSPDNRLIKEIEIKGKQGVIKRIVLENNDFFECTDAWGNSITKLSGITIQDASGANIKRYDFNYFINYYSCAAEIFTTDDWGYRNQHLGADRLDIQFSYEHPYQMPNNAPNDYIGLPTPGIIYYDTKGLDRSPDQNSAKDFALKSIVFPTGGITTFDYEHHCSTSRTEGGIRIKTISSDDGKGNINTKSYGYGNAQYLPYAPLGSTSILSAVSYTLSDARPFIDLFYYHRLVRDRIYDAQLAYQAQQINQKVLYTEVTEYFGDELNNIGKIEYEYTSMEDIYQDMPYSYSDGRFSLDLANNGAVVTTSGVESIDDEYFKSVPAKILNIGGGLLKRKSTYKSVGNQNYLLVNEVINNYKTDEHNDYPNGLINLNITQVLFEEDANADPMDVFFSRRDRYLMNYSVGPKSNLNVFVPHVFQYYAYTIDMGYSYLDSISETNFLYDEANNLVGSIKKKTSNSYTPERYQLSSSTVIDSKNQVLTTNYEYPGDFPSGIGTDGSTLTRMVEDNIIGDPIKQETLLNGVKLIDGKINNYVIDEFDNVVIDNIEFLNPGINSYEKRIKFHIYDLLSNPVEYSKVSGQSEDIYTSIIWSYNNSYPVIKGENIGYTFLESAVGTAINSVPGYSDGINDLELFLNNMSKLNSSSTRHLWSLFNTNLRSHSGLKDALITTYTYDPLIGMTSQTDPAGITTYYEYDDFGRLKYVRDEDGNVLSKNEYHYKQ